MFSEISHLPKMKEKKYQKPVRTCPFCEQQFADLSVHFQSGNKHMDVPIIQKIRQLKQEEKKAGVKKAKIIRQERLLEVDKLRKKGILVRNTKLLSESVNMDSSMLESVRKSKGDKVKCSLCDGFYNEQFFNKHKKNCEIVHSSEPLNSSLNAQIGVGKSTLSTSLGHSSKEVADRNTLSNYSSDPYIESVARKVYFKIGGDTESDKRMESDSELMNKMKKDEYFEIILEDDIIKLVGKRLLATERPNKKRSARQKARSAMRRLAKIKERMGVAEALDIFNTDNIQSLEEAIDELCKPERRGQNMKAGLKVALGVLIKQVCHILIPYFICSKDEENLMMIRNFKAVFTSHTYYSRVIGAAEYQLREKSQKETRKPKSLPDEANLQFLFKRLEVEIDTITKIGINGKADFVWARKILVSYLTLMNGKRGSEPSCLTINDWLDRDSWIDKTMMKKHDKELLQKYTITFFMGKERKGKSLVPIIFHKRVNSVLDMLADKDIRKKAHVRNANDFLFAYTGNSMDGAIGFNEIDSVCKKFGIPTISATLVRHRYSTRFWNIPSLDEERINIFLDHIGHDKDTDRGVYQCPPALPILRTVPKLLNIINQVFNYNKYCIMYILRFILSDFIYLFIYIFS